MPRKSAPSAPTLRSPRRAEWKSGVAVAAAAGIVVVVVVLGVAVVGLC